MIKKYLLLTAAIAAEVSALLVNSAPSYSASTTNKAQSACLNAVAKVTNQNLSKLSVLQAKETAKGVEIKVKVSGAAKPWLCASTKNGTVKKGSVMYSGEG
jgi:hypothetical protein